MLDKIFGLWRVGIGLLACSSMLTTACSSLQEQSKLASDQQDEVLACHLVHSNTTKATEAKREKQQSDEIATAFLDKRSSVRLPSLTFVKPQISNQLLTVAYGNETRNIIVIMDANSKRLELIGLSEVGIKLFSVSFNGRDLKYKKFILVPNGLSVEQVLLDVLLSHTKKQAWDGLLPDGYSLKDSNYTRTLLDDSGQTIYTIIFDKAYEYPRPISVKNHVFGYEIFVTYLEE